MARARAAVRRGAQASQNSNADTGLASVNYSAFTASQVIPGLISIPCSGSNTFKTGTSIGVNASSILTEPNSATINGTYRSFCIFPERMKNQPYSVSVGNANRATTDRGIGCGMSNDDGSVAVFCLVQGNSNAPNICTWAGGVFTNQATGSGFSTAGTDIIKLGMALGGDGFYTYTAYRGATVLATWKDSANVIGTPGRHPIASFRHAYSSAQYPSPGIKSLSAVLN